MDWLLNSIGRAEALIVAITALVLAAIAAYRQIMQAWKTRNELVQETLPLIAQAKVQPLELLNSLVEKPAVNVLTDEGKNTIVSRALMERKPGLLKKLKLKDILDVGSFVTSVYSGVKPLIKGLDRK